MSVCDKLVCRWAKFEGSERKILYQYLSKSYYIVVSWSELIPWSIGHQCIELMGMSDMLQTEVFYQ